MTAERTSSGNDDYEYLQANNITVGPDDPRSTAEIVATHREQAASTVETLVARAGLERILPPLRSEFAKRNNYF